MAKSVKVKLTPWRLEIYRAVRTVRAVLATRSTGVAGLVKRFLELAGSSVGLGSFECRTFGLIHQKCVGGPSSQIAITWPFTLCFGWTEVIRWRIISIGIGDSKLAPAPKKNKFDINSIFLHFPPKKGKNHQEIGHHIVFFTTPKNGNTRHNFHRCVFSIHHTKPWVRSASHTPRNQRFTQALEPMARWHFMGNSIVWPRAFYDIRILGIPSIQPSRTWHTMHFNRFRPVAIHIKAFQRSDRLTAMVNSITHPLETNAEASMKSLKAETTKRWATYYSRGMSLQTKKKEIRVHLQENFVFPYIFFPFTVIAVAHQQNLPKNSLFTSGWANDKQQRYQFCVTPSGSLTKRSSGSSVSLESLEKRKIYLKVENWNAPCSSNW